MAKTVYIGVKFDTQELVSSSQIAESTLKRFSSVVRDNSGEVQKSSVPALNAYSQATIKAEQALKGITTAIVPVKVAKAELTRVTNELTTAMKAEVTSQTAMVAQAKVIKEATQNMTAAQKLYDQSLKDANVSTKTHLSGIGSMAKSIVAAGAAYLTFQSILGAGKYLIDVSDQYTMLEGRLRLYTTSAENLASVEASLYSISMRTHQGMIDTSETYTKLSLATKSLGTSQSDLLKITEMVNKAIIVSGSGEEGKNALRQLNQAIASGQLMGDELRSLKENLPMLAQAIADGLNVPIGALKEMGAQGKLTSEVVIKALLDQSSAMDSMFSKMGVTVGQASTDFKTAFDSVINDVNKASSGTDTLAGSIEGLASNIDRNRDGIVTFFSAIAKGAVNAASGVASLAGDLGTLISLQKIKAAGDVKFDWLSLQYKDGNGNAVNAASQKAKSFVQQYDANHTVGAGWGMDENAGRYGIPSVAAAKTITPSSADLTKFETDFNKATKTAMEQLNDLKATYLAQGQDKLKVEKWYAAESKAITDKAGKAAVTEANKAESAAKKAANETARLTEKYENIVAKTSPVRKAQEAYADSLATVREAHKKLNIPLETQVSDLQKLKIAYENGLKKPFEDIGKKFEKKTTLSEYSSALSEIDEKLSDAASGEKERKIQLNAAESASKKVVYALDQELKSKGIYITATAKNAKAVDAAYEQWDKYTKSISSTISTAGEAAGLSSGFISNMTDAISEMNKGAELGASTFKTIASTMQAIGSQIGGNFGSALSGIGAGIKVLSTPIDTSGMTSNQATSATELQQITGYSSIGNSVGKVIGGSIGSAISSASTGAATGATIGSVIPGIGSVAGAIVGGVTGLVSSIFGGGGPSESQNQSDAVSVAASVKSMADSGNSTAQYLMKLSNYDTTTLANLDSRTITGTSLSSDLLNRGYKADYSLIKVDSAGKGTELTDQLTYIGKIETAINGFANTSVVTTLNNIDYKYAEIESKIGATAETARAKIDEIMSSIVIKADTVGTDIASAFSSYSGYSSAGAKAGQVISDAIVTSIQDMAISDLVNNTVMPLYEAVLTPITEQIVSGVTLTTADYASMSTALAAVTSQVSPLVDSLYATFDAAGLLTSSQTSLASAATTASERSINSSVATGSFASMSDYVKAKYGIKAFATGGISSGTFIAGDINGSGGEIVDVGTSTAKIYNNSESKSLIGNGDVIDRLNSLITAIKDLKEMNTAENQAIASHLVNIKTYTKWIEYWEKNGLPITDLLGTLEMVKTAVNAELVNNKIAAHNDALTAHSDAETANTGVGAIVAELEVIAGLL